MFHTYVLAASSKPVDFNRARLLMDSSLLRAAVKAMNKTGATNAALAGPQWVWDYYCERHAEKYGIPFRPDVDPTWDT